MRMNTLLKHVLITLGYLLLIAVGATAAAFSEML